MARQRVLSNSMKLFQWRASRMWARCCRLGNFQTYPGGELASSTPTTRHTLTSLRRWEISFFSVNLHSFVQGGCNHWQVREHSLYGDPRIHRLLSEAYWNAWPHYELCQPQTLWWRLLSPLCSVSSTIALLPEPERLIQVQEMGERSNSLICSSWWQLQAGLLSHWKRKCGEWGQMLQFMCSDYLALHRWQSQYMWDTLSPGLEAHREDLTSPLDPNRQWVALWRRYFSRLAIAWY